MTLKLLIFIILSCGANSQVSYLFDIQADEYPLVRAKFLGLNPDGTAMDIELPSDLLLIEQGDTTDILTLNCPPDYNPAPLSSILVIDRSVSVAKDGILEIEKAGAIDWVAQMREGAETAILVFNDFSMLYSGFTSDKSQLVAAIKSIQPSGSTEFDPIFFGPFKGAFQMIEENGGANPIIILMTDGEAAVEEGKVIIGLRDGGIKFFPIIITQPVPSNLKTIVDFPDVDGRYFDRIETSQQIENVMKTINLISGNATPCDISWISNTCAEYKNLSISLSSSSVSSEAGYEVDSEIMPQIEYLLSDFLIFEDTELLQIDKQFLLLKALRTDVIIDTIISNNELFTVLEDNFPEGQYPIIIPKGEEFKIWIEFNYEKKGFHFSYFDIVSNACIGNSFFAQGGEPGTAPGSGDFKVLFPNGGEQFIAKKDTAITYKGSLPAEDVLLEYTTDGGKSWQEIESEANNFSNIFPIPNANSSECRVRATKFSNVIGKEILRTSSQNIPINDIEWQPSELTIACANSDGKIRLINAYHGGPYMSSKSSHQGQARAVSWSPDATRFASVGDDGNLKIWSFISGGELTRDVSLGSAPLLDVAWSSDGRDIAVASASGEIIIVRAATMNESQRIMAHSRAVTKLAWSSDGGLLASGSRDSSIAVWKRSDWSVSVPKFKAHQGWISGIEWRDGMIISSSEMPNNNKIKIWFPALSQLVGEIDTEKGISIISLDYNKSLDLLAYSLISADTYIYDLELGIHKEYDFSTLAMAYLDWSPSGAKLASGEGTDTDHNVKIYSVDRFTQDYDESDSNFSINTISFSTKEIDFGIVPVLSSMDTVVGDYIVPSKTFPFLIDSIRISGDGEGVFTASSYDNSIFPQNFGDMVFSFTPKEARVYTADVSVYSAFGTRRKRISGEGKNLILKDTIVNFGTFHVDKLGDSTVQIFLPNDAEEDLIISNIELGGAFAGYFSIESGKASGVIKSGKKKNFVISYKPNQTGDHWAEIIMKYTQHSYSTKVNLFGSGVKPDFSMTQTETLTISCFMRDTMIVEVINTGVGELQIDSLSLVSDVFSVIDFDSFALNEGDSNNIFIEFNAINPGLNDAELIVYSNKYPINSDTLILTGEMLETSFKTESINNIFNLKSNLSNTQIDTNVIIINTGEIDINWENIPVSSDNNIFDKMDFIPLITMPGESSTLSISYAGGNYGTMLSDNYVLSDKCGNDLSIELNVEISNISAILTANSSLTFSDLICESSTFTNYLINNIGISDLIINSINLANNINFNIINKSDFINNKINSGNSRNLIIEFTGNNDGEFIDTLIIESNDDNSPFKSIIYGNKSSIKLDIPNELLFDITENNSVYSSTFIINNLGTSENYWTNLPMIINDFSLTDISPNPTPGGGQSIAMAEYSGARPDTSLFVLEDSCGISNDINFIAYSEDFPNINFILPKLDVRLNKEVNIPIKYELNDKFDQNKLLNAKFKLKFNSTLLKNINPKYNIEFAQDTGFIEIIIDEDFINLKELNTDFFVLWGNDSASYLVVDKLILADDDYRFTLNKNIGQIKILDLCKVGEGSLFFSGGLLNATILPNPADNVLIVELNAELNKEAKVELEISLYSLEGAFKSNLFSGEAQGKIKINTSGIESGIYLLKININGIISSKLLSIIH